MCIIHTFRPHSRLLFGLGPTAVIFLFPFFFSPHRHHRHLHSFPTRRSSDLRTRPTVGLPSVAQLEHRETFGPRSRRGQETRAERSEEHTSELQSRRDLVCRLLLEKKK